MSKAKKNTPAASAGKEAAPTAIVDRAALRLTRAVIEVEFELAGMMRRMMVAARRWNPDDREHAKKFAALLGRKDSLLRKLGAAFTERAEKSTRRRVLDLLDGAPAKVFHRTRIAAILDADEEDVDYVLHNLVKDGLIDRVARGTFQSAREVED